MLTLNHVIIQTTSNFLNNCCKNETANLIAFIEEILNGKLHFLCRVIFTFLLEFVFSKVNQNFDFFICIIYCVFPFVRNLKQTYFKIFPSSSRIQVDPRLINVHIRFLSFYLSCVFFMQAVFLSSLSFHFSLENKKSDVNIICPTNKIAHLHSTDSIFHGFFFLPFALKKHTI